MLLFTELPRGVLLGNPLASGRIGIQDQGSLVLAWRVLRVGDAATANTVTEASLAWRGSRSPDQPALRRSCAGPAARSRAPATQVG